MGGAGHKFSSVDNVQRVVQNRYLLEVVAEYNMVQILNVCKPE
jgi:hypothetical protein